MSVDRNKINGEVAGVKLAKIPSVIFAALAAICSSVAVVAQDQDGAHKPDRDKHLRISTWGGAYGQAQETAIIAPAAEALDITITRIAAKRDELADADVLEVTQAELLKGCTSGKLAKFDTAGLNVGANQTFEDEDFLPGAISKCGVGSFAWSLLILVDRTKFKSRAPQTLSDVFDIKRFPGKRAFIKKAENLFEFAAIATGSVPRTVYADLQDPLKFETIMERLEAVLPAITWVESQSEALEKMSSGEAVFAFAYSGRAFRRTIAGNVSALWDAHIYDFSSWAISAQAKSPGLAASFIVLATSPDYLAAQARLWPYGPMRKSAIEIVGKHEMLDIALAPYLPTSNERFATGVRYDAAFWARNSNALNDRLAALIEGFPLGRRVPPPARRP